MQAAAISGRRIQVQVFPAYRKQLSVPWLRKVAQQALIEGQTDNRTPKYRSLSLTIADDETLSRLNRDYRGLDETTDVLAFAFDYPGEYEGNTPPPIEKNDEEFITLREGREDFAGEVIVSYPQCQRQAEAGKHSLHDELALLITHGVLHLLGYDHALPEEEGVMQERERRSLAALKITDVRA